MKRSTICLLVLLLSASYNFSQSKRGNRPSGIRTQPGYYFTVSLCHACAYFGWHEDAIKGFRAKGIRAAVGGGYLAYGASNLSFATTRVFKWEQSEEFWSVELLVGPFGSEEAAGRALDGFPSVLSSVQKKRNHMDSGEGWPLKPNERVNHMSGNNYDYGFFDIRGYRLVR